MVQEGSQLRILWILILIIIAGALTTALLSNLDATEPTSAKTQDSVLPTPTVKKNDDGDGDGTESFADELATASAETTRPPAASKQGETPKRETPKKTDNESTPKGGTITLGMDRTIPSATVVAGNIRRIGPDELDVDNEFTLEGDGSEKNPYRPSWEYLYSAGDTYAPRLKKTDIPQRIALLDGQWIRVSGYTVFPLVSGKTTELLVMLNQWDGCCIGVPPTPFDAIEVGLNVAVRRGPKHGLTYGTLTGRLKVDPYLIEDWLVGLYLLEEASLEVGSL
jgi:hypothetical protein